MAAVVERPETTHTSKDWTDFQHTGPGTLAGRFMRMFWHPIYAGEDLPPGKAVPMQIMNEWLTLYRGQTGTPHAVAFRCVHRGTQLSTGWVEGDDIRCRFHGWKYSGDGQCVEQPCEPEPFCDQIRIRSYPTEEYLGLIFIYTGEGKAPPLPRFPQFDETKGIIEVAKPKLSESNYFRRVELISDEAHLIWAHRHEKAFSQHDNPDLAAEETEHGIVQTGTRPDGQVRRTHYIMPNLMYVTNGAPTPEEQKDRERLMWKVPVDDDHYFNLGVLMIFLQGEAAKSYRSRQAGREAAQQRANTPGKLRAILTGQMTLEEVDDRADISHLEDEVVLAGMGLLSNGPLEEHLGKTDVGVVIKRKIWERELQALAEGRPMKQWRLSGDGLTVSEGIHR